MRQVPVLDGVPIGIAGDGCPVRLLLHSLNGRSLSVHGRRCGVPAAGPVEALASCRNVLLLSLHAEAVSFIDASPTPGVCSASARDYGRRA